MSRRTPDRDPSCSTNDVSPASFEAMVEHSWDAVLLLDRDGCILYANRSVARLLGLPTQQVRSAVVFKHIHPEDRERVERLFAELVARPNGSVCAEFRVRGEGGAWRWIEGVATNRLSDPRICAIVSNNRDLTQRRQVEAALRSSEERMRQLTESLPQLVWSCNDEGYCDYMSPQWLEFTGSRLDEAFGHGWLEAVHPEEREETLLSWQRAVEEDLPYRVEFRLRRHDGIYHWFTTRGVPMRDETGRPIRWFGTCTDIDDQKRIEERLREQSLTLRGLNRVARIINGELDLERIVQTVTDVATELCGARFGSFFYNVLGAEGESYMLFTLSGVPREHFAHFPMPRATEIFGPTFRGEGTILLDDVRSDPRYGKNSPYYGMPDGHLPVVSYLAVPVISRSGEVLGGLFFGHPEVGRFTTEHAESVEALAAHAAVAMDNARLVEGLEREIREREIAERGREQLLDSERAARAEAERANRLKDEFLSTLSHELRTPLNAILGWSQLLALGEMGEEEMRQGMETIERNARVQVQLIEDLLDMRRILSGKLSMEPEQVDAVAIAETAMASIMPTATQNGVEIRREIATEVGSVMADPARLQQIVWNLLSNAIKFTPTGGSVTLAVTPIDGEVELAVTDTGAGIDAEFLPHIFERFRQADSSTTRRHGGLGLGLGIVRSLVELHGGRVWAESGGKGSGTTFRVRLPRIIEPGRETVRPAARLERSRHSLAGKSIVVVDDEPDARELLRRLLENYGAAIEAASSAEEAIALLESSTPDLIISDIGMPGMDGYELITRVRAMESEAGRSKLPAIALTAFARQEDRARAMLTGFDMHLPKPIEPALLVSVVESLLRDTGSEDESGA